MDEEEINCEREREINKSLSRERLWTPYQLQTLTQIHIFTSTYAEEEWLPANHTERKRKAREPSHE